MTQPRRTLRIALIAVAAVIVAAVGIGAIVIARIDPNTYKPEIAAAVKRATGRDLVLNGPITLKPSLWPTIQVSDAALSNPPGFSRPQMASLQSLELQLALIPLLSSHVQVDRLILIHPDILLETNAAGQPNWLFTPEASPTAQAGSPPSAQPPTSGSRTDVSLASVRIENGTIAYRDGRTGKLTTLGLPKLDVAATSPDAPMQLDADAQFNGTAFNLTGETGSLNRLQDQSAKTPWPVKLALAVGTAKISANGALTQPLQGKGYALDVNGTVPDASVLTALMQGYKLPPLHDVTFAAKLADNGGALPAISALTLHVGASNLDAQVPGLTLDHLDIAAAAADQPTKASAAGKLGDQPLSLAATTGALASLMPSAKPVPLPIDATAQAAGGTFTIKGTIANAQALSGANLVVTANIPDLAALSPLARRPLPAIKQITFQGTLTDTSTAGLRNGAALHGLALTSADGDLSGDAAIGLTPKINLTANLRSNRIDLDTIQAAMQQAPAPPPPAAAAAPPSPQPQRPKRGNRLFSDQPIPFDVLRTADADLTLAVAVVHGGGADYKAVNTHAVVSGGKLTVDPFAADLPGGHLSGTATVDATQAAPPVHVVLHAPGLALKTVLAAAHEPSYATGNLEVYADLRGAGATQHAIAASLDGSLGLAVPSGTIDNRLLGSLLGNVMNTLNALNLVGKGGSSELKCFGLRMDAVHGVATVRPLALSSSLLTMTGAGTVNLGDETLAMTLAPQARLAGTNVVIPVNVTGPIREPAIKVNQIGAAERNAGSVAGAVIGNATPLGIVGGLLGGDKLLGGNADICPAALAAARGQAIPAEAKSEPVMQTAPDPGAILRNLFK